MNWTILDCSIDGLRGFRWLMFAGGLLALFGVAGAAVSPCGRGQADYNHFLPAA